MMLVSRQDAVPGTRRSPCTGEESNLNRITKILSRTKPLCLPVRVRNGVRTVPDLFPDYPLP